MNKIFLACCLTLCACGGGEPLYRPVTVDIPVPCHAMATPPLQQFPALKPADDLFVKTRALLADFERQKAYAALLQDALNHCTLTDHPNP